MAEGPPLKVTKRCVVCGRFRAYDADDRFCVACGNDGLEAHCECGRSFDYVLAEHGEIHCPKCGRHWGRRGEGFE